MSARVWGPKEVEILVFTFKEGLLSRVAHDLKLKVGRLEVKISEGGAVEAWVDPRSLQVVCAMRSGRPAPEALKESDKADILESLQREVLAVERHPRITFSAPSADALGRLQICGVERPVQLRWRREGEARVAEAELDQKSFGIRPFQAMMGALKVQPVVRVQVRAPAD